MHYGLSARGLAIDTASPEGEEFPSFTEFYLERPVDANSLVIHALLNSPRCTGAYTFTVRPGDTTLFDVELTLYVHSRIDMIGIAPLTSMFFFGANDRVGADDYRPEVHDSDGLLIWNSADEWLWRPLVYPQRLRVSAFADRNPKGFGLMQRKRRYEDYPDTEANYEARPSAWIEPVRDWGVGNVTLVEIPTALEVNDNIVAFWRPDTALEAGARARRRACCRAREPGGGVASFRVAVAVPAGRSHAVDGACALSGRSGRHGDVSVTSGSHRHSFSLYPALSWVSLA